MGGGIHTKYSISSMYFPPKANSAGALEIVFFSLYNPWSVYQLQVKALQGLFRCGPAGLTLKYWE